MKNRFTAFISTTLFAFSATTPLVAQEIKITPDMPNASFSVNGTDFTIGRIQDPENRLDSEFTKTSRICPPFCIHPMSAGEGVETVGEIEVIEFLKTEVKDGTGLLVDSRIPEWFAKGSIPAAINIPFSTLEERNPYRGEILTALGATKSGEDWDFTNAKTLTLFCNGPWCDQSPQAITNLLSVGYPAEKIKYYRGGIQLWLLLGLTTTTSAE